MGDWFGVRRALSVSVEASLLRSNALRYQYTRGCCHKFPMELYMVLKQNVLGQLCKLSFPLFSKIVQDLSPNLFFTSVLNEPSFEHPEGWEYMDDMLPQLYDRIESEDSYLSYSDEIVCPT